MRILLTGAFAYTPAQLAQLKNMGLEITFVQDEREPLEMDVSAFEAVVCNGLFLYNDIRRFSSLRFIQVTSAGLDRLPLDYIRAQGIRLCNARGVYSVPMAEWAVGGVLSLYKHLNRFSEQQKNRLWEKDRTVRELAGQTVCIVGAGSVGTACAQRFKAFDTTVLAADIRKPPGGFDAYYPMDKLQDALARADVVVLTLPLTDSTRGLFDAEMLAGCKHGAVLVNIARGAVVCEAALVAALESGRLSGAVLDVFETEPLTESSPLWQMEQVLVTPHNSFVSGRNGERLFHLIEENLRAYLNQGGKE